MADGAFLDRMREAVADRLPLFRRQVALGQAYARTFDGPEGRIVLHDLLRRAGLLQSVYEPGGSAHDAIWAAGRQSIGQEILENLRWSEGELLALARERTTEELEQAREGADHRGTT